MFAPGPIKHIDSHAKCSTLSASKRYRSHLERSWQLALPASRRLRRLRRAASVVARRPTPAWSKGIISSKHLHRLNVFVNEGSASTFIHTLTPPTPAPAPAPCPDGVVDAVPPYPWPYPTVPGCPLGVIGARHLKLVDCWAAGCPALAVWV